MARLQEFYRETVVPRLKSDLNIKNAMQVPRITKITVNMGVGEAVADRKVMDAAVTDLTKITGQKPLVTKARKAIASFKLRAGLPVGAKVTLRGARMYEFLDRLINIAMPRIRDFRGVSPRSFDGQGNYSLGVKEQIIFPEIQYDQVDQIRGMDTPAEFGTALEWPRPRRGGRDYQLRACRFAPLHPGRRRSAAHAAETTPTTTARSRRE